MQSFNSRLLDYIINNYYLVLIMSQMKKDCGYAAADLVKDGQVLGLGTGSTTLYFIEKVGMRVRDEGSNQDCLLANGTFHLQTLANMK